MLQGHDPLINEKTTKKRGRQSESRFTLLPISQITLTQKKQISKHSLLQRKREEENK